MQGLPSIAVIRLKSVNHKDEFACTTLAPTTLHEESSFCTVFNTGDKNYNADNIKKELENVYLLLNNRVWFGFDIELAAKTLKRLFESVHQSPPQSLGHWEIFQMFESTFSLRCDSIASAAQHLQIFPCNYQNVDARTECDISCQVLNRIALVSTLCHWCAPNQFASPTQEETIATQNETAAENQMFDYQDNAYQAYDAQAQDYIAPDTDNVNDSANVDQSFEVTDTNAIEVEAHKTAEEDEEVVDTHHYHGHDPDQSLHSSNLNENEKYVSAEAADVEQEKNDSFLGGHVNDNYKTSEVSQTGIEDHQGNAAPSGQASWKDLAKGKQVLSSPSRPSHLHVIATVRHKKNGDQGHFKLFPPTRNLNSIKELINNAITANHTVWISYDGGREPLAPRGVKPTKWVTPSGTDAVFLGVPHNSKTGNESKFVLNQVKEIRDAPWRSDDEKANRNRNKTNKPKHDRRDEKSLGGNANATNTNNHAASNARSKPKQGQRENKKFNKSPNTARENKPKE